MDENPYKPPETRADGSSRRGAAIGGITFVVCLVLGTVASQLLAKFVTRGLPREEVYEAIAADTTAIQWCCGGTVLSLPISLIAAIVAVRLIGRGKRNDSSTKSAG